MRFEGRIGLDAVLAGSLGASSDMTQTDQTWNRLVAFLLHMQRGLAVAA